MEREEKLRIVKNIVVKVLMEIQENFPWLEYDKLKIGRDSMLAGDKTNVRLFFQRCTDEEGNLAEGPFGYQKAKYYGEIYRTVYSVLNNRLADEPRLLNISSGTYSKIKDVPEEDMPGSYYGVSLLIDLKD